jgi:hypothetical protein
MSTLAELQSRKTAITRELSISLRERELDQYRSDLLAFDLYQDAGLWWVFYQRNPNTLTAPPWDFEAGVEIFIPAITTLRTNLGF